MFLETTEDCNGFCLKNFQPIEQKLENAFLARFSSFENFETYFWLFTLSINAADASGTTDIICGRKSFQKLLQSLSWIY